MASLEIAHAVHTTKDLTDFLAKADYFGVKILGREPSTYLADPDLAPTPAEIAEGAEPSIPGQAIGKERLAVYKGDLRLPLIDVYSTDSLNMYGTYTYAAGKITNPVKRPRRRDVLAYQRASERALAYDVPPGSVDNVSIPVVADRLLTLVTADGDQGELALGLRKEDTITQLFVDEHRIMAEGLHRASKRIDAYDENYRPSVPFARLPKDMHPLEHLEICEKLQERLPLNLMVAGIMQPRVS